MTGGCGYIGHNLIKALSAVPCRIVRASYKYAQPPERISGAAARIEDIRCDVRDGRFWRGAVKGVDFIFHLAGQTSVYEADRDPVKDVGANLLPMIRLLEACRQNGKGTAVIFAATSTQAGIPAKLPVTEGHIDRPITVYDINKLAAEKYLLGYARNGLVRGASLRLTNVYGPGPAGSSAERGVLNMMIRRALAGDDLTVYGKGLFLRDYVFMDDVVAAFLAAGANMDRVNGSYYLIGSGKGTRIKDAVAMVAARSHLKTGKRPKVICVKPPGTLSPIESRNFIADPARFRKMTAWRAKVSLKDGIDATLDYYINNGSRK